MANAKRTTVAKGESKKEFEGKQLFVFWLRQDKKGNSFLSGSLGKDGVEVLGLASDINVSIYPNTRKASPKAPDYIGYVGNDFKTQVIGLWKKKAKNSGLVYLSGSYGKRDEQKTYVTGFYNLKGGTSGSKIPYLNIYLQEDLKKTASVDITSEEVPF